MVDADSPHYSALFASCVAVPSATVWLAQSR